MNLKSFQMGHNLFLLIKPVNDILILFCNKFVLHHELTLVPQQFPNLIEKPFNQS